MSCPIFSSTIGWCTVAEYSQLERTVIQHIVSHISQNRELTLTDIAEQCHVSKSTVIKALQKLGYRGFSDFHRDVRLGARSSNDALLPSRVTRLPIEEEAKVLSNLLYRHKEDRNFIFKSDRRSGDLLANYLSRKLSLFGILCPATYDYSIVDTVMGRPPGLAIFCFHKELPGKTHLGQQEGYGAGLLEAARGAGFDIVVISDLSKDEPHEETTAISIVRDQDITVDLYATRVLMLFEQTLSALSALAGGGS